MAVIDLESDDERAIELERDGHHERALNAYNAAVERKTRDYGGDSLQLAMTLQELGPLYLKLGRLAEAEDCLLRALSTWAGAATVPGDNDNEDTADFYPRKDAAVTRAALGRVYEHRGDFEAARGIRLQGLDLGQFICGYEFVSKSQTPAPLCAVPYHEMVRVLLITPH